MQRTDVRNRTDGQIRKAMATFIQQCRILVENMTDAS